MRNYIALAALAALSLCSLAHAQAVGNGSAVIYPDQAITGGLQFDQAASPQVQGDASYAKHVSTGVYSYNDVRLTSVQFVPVAGAKLPQVKVQSQTESGLCTYTANVAGFAISTCVAGGLAAVPGQSAGASASGALIGLRKAGWKDLVWGFNAGPSYSAVTGGVSWYFGLRIGWGK